jgi:hypothetical protein
MNRVAYTIFTSGPSSGIGLMTRAEAVAKAFARTHSKDVEFKVFGTAKEADVPDWLPNVKAGALFDTNQALVTALVECQPDVLLVDTYPANLVDYLSGPERPPNVWGIMRHSPGTLGRATINPELYRVFDRLYQIEPSNHGLTTWNDVVTRERSRCIAELEAGIKDIRYQEPQPTDISQFSQWPRWYKRHERGSRKLIAPIVNVDEDRILSRVKAREALLAHAELPLEDAKSKKPLVLVSLTAGHTDGKDYKAAREWMKQQFTRWGIQDLPDNERLYVEVGKAFGKLPELWRYLAGVDYFIGSAGYNTFYEARYAASLGKFQGKAAFWPMAGYIDQPWRAERQEALFSGKYYPMGMKPVTNGADYIATAIVRKLENYTRPVPAPEPLPVQLVKKRAKAVKATLEEVSQTVQEVWECGDEVDLREIPQGIDRVLFPDKQTWYKALLLEYCSLPNQEVSDEKIEKAKAALKLLSSIDGG